MKNLTIAFLATASLFAVGACKKKGGGDAGEAVAKMTEFKDQMCACKDKACADRVTEDFAALGEKHKNTKATEAQIREAGKIAEEYGKCMMAAMGATP